MCIDSPANSRGARLGLCSGACAQRQPRRLPKLQRRPRRWVRTAPTYVLQWGSLSLFCVRVYFSVSVPLCVFCLSLSLCASLCCTQDPRSRYGIWIEGGSSDVLLNAAAVTDCSGLSLSLSLSLSLARARAVCLRACACACVCVRLHLSLSLPLSLSVLSIKASVLRRRWDSRRAWQPAVHRATGTTDTRSGHQQQQGGRRGAGLPRSCWGSRAERGRSLPAAKRSQPL